MNHLWLAVAVVSLAPVAVMIAVTTVRLVWAPIGLLLSDHEIVDAHRARLTQEPTWTVRRVHVPQAVTAAEILRDRLEPGWWWGDNGAPWPGN